MSSILWMKLVASEFIILFKVDVNIRATIGIGSGNLARVSRSSKIEFVPLEPILKS